MELCMMNKILIAYLFTLTNVFAGFPPPTLSGQEQTTKPTTFNYVVPNFQATQTGGINSRIETGNSNELVNADFEHSTVDYGWSFANGTRSSSSSALSGKKALSVALTGAVEIYQESTVNAARKSGVQMVASIFVKSDDVSDLQLCSLKNGAEDKCTVTGGYVQGSGWRQLTVSFIGGATSNGLKLKSTDTTGTVLVDQAFVGVGSPIVDFTPDMVYSARVSSGSTVSLENTDWITTCSWSSGTLTCNFVTSNFTVVPNCWAIPIGNAQGQRAIVFSTTTSQVVFINRSNDGTVNQNVDLNIFCQKQGADYKTSKAYVASGSVALNTTVYSAKVSSAGVVSNENTDWINGNASVTDTSLYTITFNSSIFSVVPNCVAMVGDNSVFLYATQGQSVTASQFVVRVSSDQATRSAQAFTIICQKAGADYTAAFNPVIVGSFQGYNETPGASRPVISSVQVAAGSKTTICTTGSCTLYANRGGFVSAASWSSTGTYAITLNPSVSSISETNCVVSPINTSGGIRTCKFDSPIDSTSEIVRCTDNANSPENNLFTIMCHGSL